MTTVDAQGDTLFQKRIAYEPRRVPRNFFDEYIDAKLDQRGVVDRQAHARALRDFVGRHDYFPPVGSHFVGKRWHDMVGGAG